jgi:hypothetical protein
MGPFFVLWCGDQERNLVQQNASAFWAVVRPPGRRPENRPMAIRANPAPATRKSNARPCAGLFGA